MEGVIPKGFKRCSNGELRPKFDFWKNAKSRDGLQSMCSVCQKRYQAARKLKPGRKP